MEWQQKGWKDEVGGGVGGGAGGRGNVLSSEGCVGWRCEGVKGTLEVGRMCVSVSVVIVSWRPHTPE